MSCPSPPGRGPDPLSISTHRREPMTESQSQPERIDLAQADDRRDVVHRAVACLAQGGLVGLSTETVYGVAACALQPDAVARLRQIKGLDEPVPLTLLLKGPVEVADWVPGL